MRRIIAARVFLVAATFVVGGCNGILGISEQTYNPVDAGVDSSPGPEDAGPDVTVLPDGSQDGGTDSSLDGSSDAADASDTGSDVLTIPDVGPPGSPGLAITAGGTVATDTTAPTSSSVNYQFFGALGESPGGQVTSQSPKYKLFSGVIGTTGN